MTDIIDNKVNSIEDVPLYEQELTPYQYFEQVKSRKRNITDRELTRIYDNCLELIEKAKRTGQKNQIKRCLFHLDVIEKEQELVKLGIDTFIYKDDITYFMKNVAKDHVKIIEVENYEREIPDEIVDVIEKVRDKFDQLYIVFTDYSEELTKKVISKRDKDPILFGVFKNNNSKSVIDRFYYLGDWVDEYCDLTLDKMLSETERVGQRKIAHTIKTPEDIEELKEQIGLYNKSAVDVNHLVINTVAGNPPKKHFFDKIKSIFKK